MKWSPFTHLGVTYSLNHLHDTTISFVQPSKGDNAERLYTVDVEYGLHCFTRGFNINEDKDTPYKYSDSRESRYFDVSRYELSKKLPEIVIGLQKKKCFHSGKGNFFVVELVSEAGITQSYEVYFSVSNAKNGNLKLFIQSAYVRTKGKQPQKKPIGFSVILHNITTNKVIRIPQ